MLRLLLACAIIGLTYGWPRITIPKRSAPLASGSKMKWTPTRVDSARRLELELVESHSNTSNSDCIVGGYDTDNPLKIYVGGPCAGLTINGDDVSTNEDFRWMEMETILIDLTDGNNSAPMSTINGSGVSVGKEEATHAEIAVGGSMAVEDANMSHAAVYACTTSYLAKATFQYNMNSFAIGENETDRVDQCVAPCCSDPGDDGCQCTSGCPDTMLNASAGMFKYSIMAASYNLENSIAGATGNGWERVVEEIGEGASGSKIIHGFMDIYQLLDFTNMQADTLTITSPGGAITTYSNMGTCDMSTGAGCDENKVEVESMTVASGLWTGQYAFPQTYNLGSWNSTQAGFEATVEMTKKVLIECVKPTATWMTDAFGTDTDAKVVLVRYRFDISGITADETSGKFVNYDPVVTSDEPPTPSPTPSPTASPTGDDSGSGNSGTNSGDGTTAADDSGSGNSGTNSADDGSDTPAATDASSAWGIAPGGLLALTMALMLA